MEKHPKVENGRFNELLSVLGKKVQEDSNVIVVILASNCIEMLAKGLRKDFNPFKSLVLPNVIERLKEKKSNVVDALKSCLDALFSIVI